MKGSAWAVARVGDELDVIVWLWRKTGKVEWLDYARNVVARAADWTSYYHRGGNGCWGMGYRCHIVNYMQGLKTPPLKWLLGGDEMDRTAFRAALAPDGWAMRKCGRPDRAVNGTEPLSDRSSTQGTELCATAEHILSSQVALETLGDADIADDMEVAAYNTLPATLAPDGKGIRYFCLLNQTACNNKKHLFNNGVDFMALVPGPYSCFGCCRSNFHFAWPKFAETMSQRERAARAYKDINLLAIKLLNPGGQLFTFSCSGAIDDDLFAKIVDSAASDAHRPLRTVRWLSQGPDHPVLTSFPEGRYLKGLQLVASI